MRYVLIANLQNDPNYIYPKNYINPISGLHNPILYNYGGAGPSTSNPPILYHSGGAAGLNLSENHCVISDENRTTPKNKNVENAIKAFLRQHSRIKVRSATISRAIESCKLDTADDDDRRKLLQIMKSMPPGYFKRTKARPSQAADALIHKYNHWRENRRRNSDM
jgi:hypothetical protein